LIGAILVELSVGVVLECRCGFTVELGHLRRVAVVVVGKLHTAVPLHDIWQGDLGLSELAAFLLMLLVLM